MKTKIVFFISILIIALALTSPLSTPNPQDAPEDKANSAYAFRIVEMGENGTEGTQGDPIDTPGGPT